MTHLINMQSLHTNSKSKYQGAMDQGAKVSTYGARNLPTVKCTLHAVVSENASFGTIDITDFISVAPCPPPNFSSSLRQTISRTSSTISASRPSFSWTASVNLFSTPKSTKLFPAFLKPGSMPITNLLPIYSNTAISKPPSLPFLGI